MHRVTRRCAVGIASHRTSSTIQSQRRSIHFRSNSNGSQSYSTGSSSSFSSSTIPTSDPSSRNVASAASFFFDAKAACKGKKCAMGKDGSGIVSNPATCGEDSFFVTPRVVGVADGVGGWNENGVDPGMISRSLMRNAGKFVKQQDALQKEVTTLEVLSHGFDQALQDDEVVAGSTTACIVRLKQSDKDGKLILEYTNLGDSGFVLIRNGIVMFRSKFQYYGRAPYQLAKVPLRFKIYGAIENQPTDGDSGEIEVKEGDLIVLATDGVWDNFAPDLASAPAFQPPLLAWRRYWQRELTSFVDVIEEDPDKAAENIVRAAVRHNLKPDDVTVVVAKVVNFTAKL